MINVPPRRSSEHHLPTKVHAVDLSDQFPPSQTAFSVDAVILNEHGNETSRGYSRETDAHVHAQKSALAKLSATLYSSLEPLRPPVSPAETM
ncbi:hypothetical protein [Nonomuraea sp. NPDC005501]|uniref:hypothetical protein n=1 Tax=Nonomuraea sp. NPDC005501 TaxID=3156884 RepID=UPI0033B2B012